MRVWIVTLNGFLQAGTRDQVKLVVELPWVAHKYKVEQFIHLDINICLPFMRQKTKLELKDARYADHDAIDLLEQKQQSSV